MWIVLWWWLFRSSFTHWNKGIWIEYSLSYGICDIGKYDLIWFDLTRHSKSHWKQHSLWTWIILLYCRFASNKYFSIPFLFSRFRCSCSRKSHSSKVSVFVKLENTAFLSLAGRRRRKSSSVVVEIVVCLIATNFNHSANPIAREFHPV